jgi:hypothetical protein
MQSWPILTDPIIHETHPAANELLLPWTAVRSRCNWAKCPASSSSFAAPSWLNMQVAHDLWKAEREVDVSKVPMLVGG